MKPLNLDNRPCSPVSSNCVVWQGPDISCINICNGDTVSDVVATLATELCTILDQTNVNNYDLSCLGITACGPKDFQALIQLLITKICEAQGITSTVPKATDGCPDCVVSVAPCFQVGNQTTMQLLDYVQMIAEKVCALIDEITTINSQITDILIRLEELENAPVPDTEIPAFTLGCQVGTLPADSVQYINITLQEFINNVWCDFYTATGTASEILSVLEPDCILNTDITSDPNWIAVPETLADAINNIWVALCNQTTTTVAVANTSSVEMFITAGPDYTISAKVIDTGWLPLNGFGYYDESYTGTASFKPQCRRIGNVVHFRGYLVVPLATSSVDGTPLVYKYQSSGGVEDSYFTVAHPYTAFSGAGSCQVNTSGFINFNQGANVIPVGILSPGETLDQTYGFGYRIAYRPIDVGTHSSMLVTLGSVAITSAGILQWGTTTNSEESIMLGGQEAFNTSPINYIQSIVRAGEYVPQFSAATSSYDSSAVSGNVNTVLNFPALPPDAGIYPFSANCTLAAQIGGHGMRLDGLTAFINPCTESTIVGIPC